MSDGTFQLVVEIRRGEPEENGWLRPDLVTQLTVDVAPGLAWKVFRDAVAAVQPPDLFSEDAA